MIASTYSRAVSVAFCLISMIRGTNLRHNLKGKGYFFHRRFSWSIVKLDLQPGEWKASQKKKSFSDQLRLKLILLTIWECICRYINTGPTLTPEDESVFSCLLPGSVSQTCQRTGNSTEQNRWWLQSLFQTRTRLIDARVQLEWRRIEKYFNEHHCIPPEKWPK